MTRFFSSGIVVAIHKVHFHTHTIANGKHLLDCCLLIHSEQEVFVLFFLSETLSEGAITLSTDGSGQLQCLQSESSFDQPGGLKWLFTLPVEKTRLVLMRHMLKTSVADS